MKNKFLKITLASIFAFSSLALFACGGASEPNIQYTELPNIVTEMNSNHTMFKSGSVDGVTTNFIFNALDGDDNYFNECFVIPMNYINKYNLDIEEVKRLKGFNGEQSAAIAELEKDLATFKHAYVSANNEYERLTIFSSESGSIYDGALQQYKYSVTKLISGAYDVAISLSKVQDIALNRFNLQAGGITNNDALLLKDYLSLKIGQDYFKVLLDNSNSKLFKTSADLNINKFVYFVNGVKADLTAFVKDFYGKSNLKDLNNDEADGDKSPVSLLVKSQNIMENERQNLNRSLDRFSLYEFYNSYNCNMISYQGKIEYAETYYNEIQNYYKSFIKLQTNYMKSILIG